MEPGMGSSMHTGVTAIGTNHNEAVDIQKSNSHNGNGEGVPEAMERGKTIPNVDAIRKKNLVLPESGNKVPLTAACLYIKRPWQSSPPRTADHGGWGRTGGQQGRYRDLTRGNAPLQRQNDCIKE